MGAYEGRVCVRSVCVRACVCVCTCVWCVNMCAYRYVSKRVCRCPEVDELWGMYVYVRVCECVRVQVRT